MIELLFVCALGRQPLPSPPPPVPLPPIENAVGLPASKVELEGCSDETDTGEISKTAAGFHQSANKDVKTVSKAAAKNDYNRRGKRNK